MLGSLRHLRYRLVDVRAALGLAAVVLITTALALQMTPASPAPPSGVRAIADELQAATWAMSIPVSWLAAPAPRARPGDAFDLLAIRSGDRAVAVPVAYAVVLLSADDRGLTVQVDQDDAVTIANARGSGMQLIALLRSTR